MNLTTYNHHFGSQAIKGEILQPLFDALKTARFEIKKGCATPLRKVIERFIQMQGWSGNIKIDKAKKITLTSMKENVGFCLQTGNVGRFYADMLKLQTLYLNGKIEAGICILPTKQAANVMGDNLANFDRFVEELYLYRKIITIPIFVIGIDI
ncbi:BglII/BstYI family type II restriction endonuclease [Paenibacillus farraposensis]|uniref:BglII/BstYI family type II restriction endonuclease n=1 Tax=Paenibacillus farraposensis TaxID=2807095 RepID=A0ABW4DE62_9BACL|nr:BglII/BstYI family type II restriction endonuclease [Paenibacillus farraposensis]MCC3378452.1 restriction endonuclease [Paenibacillus farraposensis]